MELRIRSLTVALREPLRSAHGTVAQRELFEVELEGADGVVGRGEAAPLDSYDGVSAELVRAALDAHARVIGELPDDSSGPHVIESCRAVADLPQAVAAVDLALWDRAARRSGRPVVSLLADEFAPQVEVNATIGALDRAGAATAAAAAAAAGFRCLKVKVGAGDDAGRVAAVRATVGQDLALRLDANGAWDVEEAVKAIEVLEPAGLELVEEPVHGVDELREVRRRVPVRVAMDETAGEHGALASGAADAVCLKIARCGGISGTLAAAALVRATGAEPYLASTLDGPLGIAAALACATALRVQAPCGLATLGLLDLDDPFPPRDGRIGVPTAPGLMA